MVTGAPWSCCHWSSCMSVWPLCSLAGVVPTRSSAESCDDTSCMCDVTACACMLCPLPLSLLLLVLFLTRPFCAAEVCHDRRLTHDETDVQNHYYVKSNHPVYLGFRLFNMYIWGVNHYDLSQACAICRREFLAILSKLSRLKEVLTLSTFIITYSDLISCEVFLCHLIFFCMPPIPR